MSIEIDGVEYRTEKQWERAHRHVDKRKKGVEREWNSPGGGKVKATFYCKDQTRPWTDAERKRERQRKADEKAEAKLRRQLVEAKTEGKREQLVDDMRTAMGAWAEPLPKGATDDHTAYQWLELGFVPIAEARWYPRCNDFYDETSRWFYCRPWDVRWNPDRANELLESGPNMYDRLPDGTPYDGHPWW